MSYTWCHSHAVPSREHRKRQRDVTPSPGPPRLPEGYDTGADGMRNGIMDETDYGGETGVDWEPPEEAEPAMGGPTFLPHDPSIFRTPDVPHGPPSRLVVPQSRSVGLTGAPVIPPMPPTSSSRPSPVRPSPRVTMYVPGYGFDRAGSASIGTSYSLGEGERSDTPPVRRPAISPELTTGPSRPTSEGRPSTGLSSDRESVLKGPLRGPPGIVRRLATDSQAPLFTPTQDEDCVPEISAPPSGGVVYGFGGDDSESVGLTPGPETQMYRR
jgi:hypothetical protein